MARNITELLIPQVFEFVVGMEFVNPAQTFFGPVAVDCTIHVVSLTDHLAYFWTQHQFLCKHGFGGLQYVSRVGKVVVQKSVCHFTRSLSGILSVLAAAFFQCVLRKSIRGDPKSTHKPVGSTVANTFEK